MRHNITLARFVRYVRALRHLYSKRNPKGRGKFLSWEEIEERLKVCEGCEHLRVNRCDLCGCCTTAKHDHLNKLAFPQEECPAVPPKWLAHPSDKEQVDPE